ncbi:MAG: hypothetical protein VB045_01610 [Synergistaceae bacterium]|nr:hypothetical protein [Synergistaceae bacterium]
MKKETLFSRKTKIRITNGSAWFALLISIVSLFLTIKYRPDQFAAIRYEQQLAVLSEIPALILESQAYVYPYILLDKKMEDIYHLIERIVVLQEKSNIYDAKIIFFNERKVLWDKETDNLFSINWDKVEVFSLDVAARPLCPGSTLFQ